jgi:glutamate-1-semialdehyde 2,1-aminomutase
MFWRVDASGSEEAIVPFGAGVPRASRRNVEIVALNDDAALERVFKARGEEIACVVIEPIVGNAGSISATPEWLQKLRDLCTGNGSLLVFDEVKTGFRVAKGGAQVGGFPPRPPPREV